MTAYCGYLYCSTPAQVAETRIALAIIAGAVAVGLLIAVIIRLIQDQRRDRR